jgi:hypothetical protein
MAGMSDLEVRDLTGSYAPSNGKVSMYSVLPAEWQVLGQPDGANMVFSAWSGGAGDPLGKRLLVHGGGHFDSSNNGLYVFDFSGETAPTGWSVAPNSLSARSAVTRCTETYADGKPTSIHTYNQLFYDTNRRRFYRFGGSPHCENGAGMPRCFYYDFQSTAWVTWITNANVAADLGASLIGSPDGTKLLYLAGMKTPFFVDVASGAVTVAGSTPFGTAEAGPCSAYDSRRGRWVVFLSRSGGPQALIVSVNWNTNSWSHTMAALTGTNAADLNASGPCVLYDAARDSFWVFASKGAPSSAAYFYEVNAGSFSVTRHTLSKPIPTYSDTSGSYNRHVWFEPWRIVGSVHMHDRPVSLVKLPSG